MTGLQSFTFQAGYGWLLSHKWDHPRYDTTTNSSEGGSGFLNVGVDLGLFELTGVYRVWSIVHNVNKSCKIRRIIHKPVMIRINWHTKKCI